MSDLLSLLTDLEKNPVARQYTDGEYNLAGFAAWLDQLGRPQDATPWIHLAGTKGKGSTAAMVEALMLASGQSTGLFTSPHLTHYGERFRLGGRAWSLGEFQDALRAMEPHVLARGDAQRNQPGSFRTVFEVLTALAFRAFGEARVDVGILETGLGGRLDCTNVVDPAVSVITPIGLDHTKVLGSTIEAIAREKAGIIKPGRPVVIFDPIDERQHRARVVIEQHAREAGAPMINPPRVEIIEDTDVFPRQRLRLDWKGERIEFELALMGAHQARNFGLAVAAAEAFLESRGRALTAEAIRHAGANVNWPGRFEVHGDAHRRVVLDGAHCPLSARALGRTLRANESHLARPRVLLWGMQADKNYAAFLDGLIETCGADWFDAVIAVAIPGPRGGNPTALAQAASQRGMAAGVAENVADAIKNARSDSPSATLVATGSLYFLSEVRRLSL